MIDIGDTRIEPCRVFCIGMNYGAHVHEMGGRIPEQPVVFMKPRESLVPAGTTIPFPAHGQELHHEAEMVVAIGDAQAMGWERVAGVGLGLDLTLRDLQSRLKAAGLPWEPAKAFEGSAPLGGFVRPRELADPDALRFECRVNGELRQVGETADLLFPVPDLLAALSRVWRLRTGDLVYTGTPSGIGPLRPGDRVEVASDEIGIFTWHIGPVSCSSSSS